MQMIFAEELEGSVHPPSVFIQQHWQRLLPHWTTPVLSMLILLQRSPVALDEYTHEAAISKQYLRDRAIGLMQPIITQVFASNYEATLFDPRTGLPHRFPIQDPIQGIPLNDVAVVNATLGYRIKSCGQCYCMIHPRWGSHVYPTVLLSSASPSTLGAITQSYF